MNTVETIRQARGLINPTHRPVVVRIMRDGQCGYDAFPHGWPIPRNRRLEDGSIIEIMERCERSNCKSGFKWTQIIDEV